LLLRSVTSESNPFADVLLGMLIFVVVLHGVHLLLHVLLGTVLPVVLLIVSAVLVAIVELYME